MRKKLEKTSTKKSCYPFFDHWLAERLKSLKKEREMKRTKYRTTNKNMTASVSNVQPKRGVRLSTREIAIAKRRLRKEGKRE